MKVLIPLAGRGSRFLEDGYATAKPLIKIIKRPMIEWAMANLTAPRSDLIFFVLKKHNEQFELEKQLREVFSDEITVVPVDKETEGAPLTLLLEKDRINTEEEILIWNGDQHFLGDVVQMAADLPEEYSGMIPCFFSTQTKFSYVKVDDQMRVLRVAEKVPISGLATVGVYYFRRGQDFVWAAEQMIRKDIRRGNEFFVPPAYNELIERGERILAIPLEDVWPLGSPEDVQYFEKFYREEPR